MHDNGEEPELQPPHNAYYRGHLEDDLASHVYLVLHATGGRRGIIRSEGQLWVIEGATADSRLTTVPKLQPIAPGTKFSGRSFRK